MPKLFEVRYINSDDQFESLFVRCQQDFEPSLVISDISPQGLDLCVEIAPATVLFFPTAGKDIAIIPVGQDQK